MNRKARKNRVWMIGKLFFYRKKTFFFHSAVLPGLENSTKIHQSPCSWGILGALGRSWGALGPFWANFWDNFGRFGVVLERLGPLLGSLGCVLERLVGSLGASWSVLGRSWDGFGVSWGCLGLV